MKRKRSTRRKKLVDQVEEIIGSSNSTEIQKKIGLTQRTSRKKHLQEQSTMKSSSTKKEYKCDVCSTIFQGSSSFLIPTKVVLTTHDFWMFYFIRLAVQGYEVPDSPESLRLILVQFAGSTYPWFVCENCSAMFSFNREEASSLANQFLLTGESPKGFELVSPSLTDEDAFFTDKDTFERSFIVAQETMIDFHFTWLKNYCENNDPSEKTIPFAIELNDKLLSSSRPIQEYLYKFILTKIEKNSPYLSNENPEIYRHTYLDLINLGLSENELPSPFADLMKIASLRRIGAKENFGDIQKIENILDSSVSCEICGWEDGYGIQPCHYSESLGAVIHSNSKKAAKASMTQEQIALWESYECNTTHTCGGNGVLAAPFYIRCTKCSCDVKLWQHGINFDLG